MLLLVLSCSDETHLHWFHASTMELDTEFELIGILIGEAPALLAPAVDKISQPFCGNGHYPLPYLAFMPW